MRRGGGNTRDTLWPLAGSMASGHWEVCAEGPPGYGVDFLKALVTTCPLCDLLFVVQVHVSSSDQPLLSIQRAFRGHMAGWARVWWILFI